MPAMDSSEQHGLVAEYSVPILTGAGTRASPASADGPSSHKAPGWTPLLVLAAAVTSLGAALPVGFNIGVINTPAEIIKGFCNASVVAHYEVELTAGQLDLLWSVVVSMFLVGAMTASMTGGWVADRFGRKGALETAMALSLLGALLFLVCKYVDSVEMLLLARLIVGLSSGLTTSVMPMYLTELAPVHLRGALGVICPMGINFGVFAGQFAGLDWLFGNEASWHVLLALFGPLAVVCGVLVPVLPESPKYLYLVRGEEQRGVRELARVRRLPEAHVGDELRALRTANTKEATGQPGRQPEWTLGRVLRAPELLLPVVLVVTLCGGQQFSGINAVFYYSSSVFQTAGLTPTQSQYATLGCGAINFATSVLAVRLVNGCGRRPLMMLSTTTAVVFLSVLGTSILTIKMYSWVPYVATVSVLAYVLVYGLGMGPIPYFIGSEIFDVGPRPLGMALGSLANWGGNFVVALAFPAMQGAIGPASFYVFAAFTTLQFVILKIYLPETKGRDTTEIAYMLRLGFKSYVDKDVKAPQSADTFNNEESP
ncbi:Solute carrier family 2, facilitated glucose transporter member 1 [Frankliniella fusca]|uniref:Solute carrier family 2, facilitated glucose transporter member 1 n=1 Tax=Frankliniella fusca TaxID=407009 RepID=A0AAE1HZD8_9NEOP|nr:Solute carrier family 2, facilitated glucose transporter member 1 [Frankliniella fusca]